MRFDSDDIEGGDCVEGIEGGDCIEGIEGGDCIEGIEGGDCIEGGRTPPVRPMRQCADAPMRRCGK
jgi:hypothetical protein